MIKLLHFLGNAECIHGFSPYQTHRGPWFPLKCIVTCDTLVMLHSQILAKCDICIQKSWWKAMLWASCIHELSQNMILWGPCMYESSSDAAHHWCCLDKSSQDATLWRSWVPKSLQNTTLCTSSIHGSPAKRYTFDDFPNEMCLACMNPRWTRNLCDIALISLHETGHFH